MTPNGGNVQGRLSDLIGMIWIYAILFNQDSNLFMQILLRTRQENIPFGWWIIIQRRRHGGRFFDVDVNKTGFKPVEFGIRIDGL